LYTSTLEHMHETPSLNGIIVFEYLSCSLSDWYQNHPNV